MPFELLGLTNYVRYLDIERVLFELLGLTNYVRYLDIERVLFELLGLTNYVRYLDIERVLFELLGLTNNNIFIYKDSFYLLSTKWMQIDYMESNSMYICTCL